MNNIYVISLTPDAIVALHLFEDFIIVNNFFRKRGYDAGLTKTALFESAKMIRMGFQHIEVSNFIIKCYLVY